MKILKEEIDNPKCVGCGFQNNLILEHKGHYFCKDAASAALDNFIEKLKKC